MGTRTYATGLKRTALAVALGMCFAGAVDAQSNITGTIFGQVPAQAGTTVVIENLDTGLSRTIQADAQGRYRATSLPNGRYRVTLQRDGNTVSVRDNIEVNIAGGVEVSFAGPASLDAVTVTGDVIPVIDVSQTDTRTVLTAEQISKISIGRNVADLAMLAPSVVRNDSYSANGSTVPSFGGSASSENAYFINGYNVTNPLTSLGFSTLPFDAIGEQQILTGGYGAEFGRSTGGVINIVTKRGTNEWKGGVYAIWTPESTRAAPRDLYYPDTGFYPVNGPATVPPGVPNQRTDGTLNVSRDQNLSWSFIPGMYFSGPLIKDRLFIYANAESVKREGTEVLSTRIDPQNSNAAQTGWREYRFNSPRWATKIDWNINDNNVIEFTGIQDRTTSESKRSDFFYSTLTHATVPRSITTTDDNARLYVGKYTGYLTDALTVSALYGRQTITHNNSLPSGYDPTCPAIVSTPVTVRAPGIAYNNCQVSASNVIPVTQNEERTKGWRLDVSYLLGDHELRVGYEKQTAEASQHTHVAGDARWTYARTLTPAANLSPIIGSPASAGGLGTQGYYVVRSRIAANSDPGVEQTSQYIEDRWHVTDNFLLSLGLRNEQFTNFDGLGRPYISQRHQLDPRIGFSWDMFGDSSFKLFGNAGRYHLATPNQAAIRGASASLNTSEYFTYTGTDPRTGAPTGLASIPLIGTSTTICPGTNQISPNAECGTAPDPLTTTAQGIKSHYQDEYIAGFEHAFSPAFAWGAKFTYRELKSAIDDICGDLLRSKCLNANPGETNTFIFRENNGTYTSVTVSAEQMGFPKLKRKYYALDLFAEHPFSDKWYGKAEYTFSRNWGNTEGQLASDLDTGAGGQADVGRTQDWDLWQLMVGSNGLLPNHRKHQLKVFGYYQWTDQWRTGATLLAASGRPRNCTSHFPLNQDSAALYNGAAYWFCGLSGRLGTNTTTNPTILPAADYRISPRGSFGETPWSIQLNLNVAYEPKWADGKLTLQADVINVLNRQTPGQYNPRIENGSAADRRNTPNTLFGQGVQTATPRYLQLTARYDF